LSEPTKTPKQVRIPDVDTKNRALFVKAAKSVGNWNLKVGLRYDKTDIDANGFSDPALAAYIPAPVQNYYRGKTSKSYDDVSANIVAKYKLDAQNSFYVALGQGIRVPDAQELYFIAFKNGNWMRQGNPDLKESKNREIDLGYEGSFDTFTLKANLFYSRVKDYIYAYKRDTTLTWTNIDAHFWGGDVSVVVPIGDFYMVEASAAYQRGKKDDLIPGQTDDDMAMVPPLRGRVAFSYDDGEYFGMIEVLASAKYEDIDSDNGEQPLKSWSVVNLKAAKELYNNVKLNVGIDNLFDKTYALNNTYVGRALVGGREPVLINEPGRFIYANLNISF
jgi:iron complex outermembrane receptor protein